MGCATLPHMPTKNPHAVALGRARWAGLSADERTEIARAGAEAANANMTAEQRRANAAKAGQAAARKRRKDKRLAAK